MNISVAYDFEDGLFRLMVSSPGMSAMPCGVRIFRAAPHPDVKFEHENGTEAEADAKKIRAYLAALPSKKPSKKEVREVGA